jgi:bifunctional non-homologous end joining protein LigD
MAARLLRSGPQELPAFIPPMLAKPGMPFDSAEHLFEIKWDGTRTLSFIDQGRYRLVNRRRVDMTDRYPEFAFLAQLPPGTMLDGEMVVLRDGKPDFGLLQSREQSRTPLKIRTLARSTPASYIVFDLLYENFQSVMARPLQARRERLRELVKPYGQGRLVLSEGIVGQGKAFFQEACRQGLEGVVAKRLQSSYLPGRRTDAWIKIKRSALIDCAIIGFVPAGQDDFRSLILAAQDQGQLRCVGKVGTGFPNKLRRRLNELLWARLRPKPLVPCRIRGKWVEPGLYCRVSCMERTSSGELRAPVFEELIEEERHVPGRDR